MSKNGRLPEMSPAEQKPAGTPLEVTVAKPTVSKKSLYWCGTLPAEGVVELTVPATEYNDDLDGWVKRIKTTADKLWRKKDIRIWLGKCRHYQSLDAGITFPAYREEIQIDHESGARAAITHPGDILALTDEEVSIIFEKTIRTVIRNGKLYNLDQGKHGKIDASDPKTIPYTPELVALPGDHPVAEFVYMVKVKDDATKYNPEEFFKYIPMSMEQFFENPPPMLAKFVEQEKVA